MPGDDYTLFEAVLEQLPEGLIILDDTDKIVSVNRAAEKIRRISAHQVVGRSVIQCHLEKSSERVKRALQYLRRDDVGTFSRMVIDTVKDKCYENIYSGIRDSQGKYIGAIVISRDVTEKRKLEEERTAHLQNLEEQVAELSGKLQDLFISSMASLVNTLEAKDPYTEGHSMRVSAMAMRMAEYRFGVGPLAKEVELAGKLHDIGKIGIREAVLSKPGRLEEAEFEHIKEHPLTGERILTPIEKLRPIAKLIRHHHERFGGGGYPDGLKGDEIPIGSRVLAVVDSYDAMTSARPYRPPMMPENAAKKIEKNLGTQFDPEWGGAFLELFRSGSIG